MKLAPPQESIGLPEAGASSTVERIAGKDGVPIPVRVYGEDGGRTPVVMLHGLQSHSGWFVQSAGFLARSGFPVYAIDRRGSGLSAEPRGDCGDFRSIIEDIASVADRVKAVHGVNTIHVFGHCFGAMPATAFACAKPEEVRSLILATPGLFTKNELSLGQKLRILGARAAGRPLRIPAPLEPGVFSEREEYVRFIRADKMALESVTGSLFFEILRMRRYIGRSRGRLAMPTIMLCAGQDPICDNARNRRFFGSLPSRCKLFVEYEKTRHVLEFGVQKEEFFGDLVWWLGRFEQPAR